MTRTILTIAALCIASSGAAVAQTQNSRAKHARPAPTAQTPDCPRAAYKGDPVCFGADEATDLPTPSAGAVERNGSKRDVRINDSLSIQGSTDVKSSDKAPIHLNIPNPNPHTQDMSGGAAVNYKF